MLVKLIGTKRLPAAAPLWEVSTLIFSPDEAQLATAVLGETVGAAADVAGDVAGALGVGGVLGDVAEPGGELLELEPHAATSSAVPSSAVTPSARPCRAGTDRPMMVSSLSVRQPRRLL
jgi:hypothetical protein